MKRNDRKQDIYPIEEETRARDGTKLRKYANVYVYLKMVWISSFCHKCHQ
jgi:hypothetical protein